MRVRINAIVTVRRRSLVLGDKNSVTSDNLVEIIGANLFTSFGVCEGNVLSRAEFMANGA